MVRALDQAAASSFGVVRGKNGDRFAAHVMVDIAVLGFIAVALASIVLTLVNYPYDTDQTADGEPATIRAYYRDAYLPPRPSDDRFGQAEQYVTMARAHAEAARIPQLVQAFIQRYRLASGLALEVGAGSGLLQDIVTRYVAMDLSQTAGRFFAKPFVQASATAIPFGDNSFDVLWCIWVLEHVPRPAQALEEMRRVVRPGGYIYLRPAWQVDSWAAEGYEVREYRDLTFRGKLTKASIPLRLSRVYGLFYTRQIRLIRTLATLLRRRPSTLHFRRLRPNFDKYWVTDSDAVVSLDFCETCLWFATRGDECLETPSLVPLMLGLTGQRRDTLIIRVRKSL